MYGYGRRRTDSTNNDYIRIADILQDRLIVHTRFEREPQTITMNMKTILKTARNNSNFWENTDNPDNPKLYDDMPEELCGLLVCIDPSFPDDCFLVW